LLNWPDEITGQPDKTSNWSHPGSNYCLDFHGNPATAQLTVLSDGNHHMALHESLKRFKEFTPNLTSVFYATTPPGPLLELLKKRRLRIKNLEISVTPDVFICPPDILQQLVKEHVLSTNEPFMQNRGSVLLVKKGNPKNILGVRDLTRDDVTLFLSNPVNEKVSCRTYKSTIKGLGGEQGIAPQSLLRPPNIFYGERIHHREAPQCIADEKADVALLFYHLALRYVRIFPNKFELIPLGGTAENPEPTCANIIGQTHYGLTTKASKWGAQFTEFLKSDTVTRIYEFHGLQRSKNVLEIKEI